MIKNILVPLTGFESDATALDTAYEAARPFGGRLDCVRIRPSPATFIAAAAINNPGMPYSSNEMIEALEKQGAVLTGRARAAFDAFCGRRQIPAGEAPAGSQHVSAIWREIIGDAVAETVREGRFNDLVVLGRASGDSALPAQSGGAVLTACGRPVLIAPEKPSENPLRNLVIAWKDTAEAARAVTAAMPLLAEASNVHVLCADENRGGAEDVIDTANRLATHLQRHGMNVEARCVVPGKRSVPDALLETARHVGADLLVMGAYGHSRAREMVFGGFTRHVLTACEISAFLAH